MLSGRLPFDGGGAEVARANLLLDLHNLYANSVIAIDVDTGKIVWHYQHVPNDSWDYDSISENIPFDLKKGGKVIKAIGNFHKNGFYYVNDRKTGKLIKNGTYFSAILLESSGGNLAVRTRR